MGVIFLSARSEGATQASCKIQTIVWDINDQHTNLKACYPDISVVDDEDFTISSTTNLTIAALNIRDKDGVKFLPKNLFSLFPDLVAVQVWNCSVTMLNENHFKGLSKLKLLSLGRNKIEHVPGDAFADLTVLEELILGYNRIRSLGKNCFSSLKTLGILYLSHNEIHFLHPRIFNSLTNVHMISLRNNEIFNLHENIFKGLANLREIYLLNNEIRTVPSALFKSNLKLTKVRLEDNEIEFIGANMFDHLPNLYNVDLQRNQCTKGNYFTSTFNQMRNDLKQSCAFHDPMADLGRKLDAKSEEVNEMRKNFDEKLSLLERMITASHAILNKRVEAVNETFYSTRV